MKSLGRSRSERWIDLRPRGVGRRLSVLGAVVLLGACSPATLINAFVPDEGYVAHVNLAYGVEDRQVLDLYVPEDAPDLAPVVVYFYGGSWRSGSRGTYRFMAEALAARGFAVAVPDYRLYPDVRFPTFVEDGARAVRWVRDHARDFGGDPDRIVLMGHSAGAHTAALLAYDERYLADAGVPAASVRGMVGIAGPYAFDPLAYRTTRPIFEGVSDVEQAKPITFVGGEDVPALLLHGAEDTTVLPRNSHELAARIRRAEGRAIMREYADTAHIGIILSFARPFRGHDTVYEDTIRFLEGL